jgi:hypothetical protein
VVDGFPLAEPFDSFVCIPNVFLAYLTARTSKMYILFFSLVHL